MITENPIYRFQIVCSKHRFRSLKTTFRWSVTIVFWRIFRLGQVIVDEFNGKESTFQKKKKENVQTEIKFFSVPSRRLLSPPRLFFTSSWCVPKNESSAHGVAWEHGDERRRNDVVLLTRVEDEKSLTSLGQKGTTWQRGVHNRLDSSSSFSFLKFYLGKEETKRD